MGIVTLITDFGLADSYVGEVKATLSSVGGVPAVDITHDIRPGDLWGGAFILSRIWDRFPPETVHLCVVDPTVGSERRAIAARLRERWLVAPDNGLVTFVERGPPGGAGGVDGDPEADTGIEGAWTIAPGDETSEPSSTFHGRDVFAPAAAALADGRAEDVLGDPVDPAGLVRLEVPEPRREGARLGGRVVHIDRFGNLITDVPVEWAGASPAVDVGGSVVRGFAESYADVAPGEPLLTKGSGGTLEISVRDGSAAERFGTSRGATIDVEVGPPPA